MRVPLVNGFRDFLIKYERTYYILLYYIIIVCITDHGFVFCTPT